LGNFPKKSRKKFIVQDLKKKQLFLGEGGEECANKITMMITYYVNENELRKTNDKNQSANLDALLSRLIFYTLHEPFIIILGWCFDAN